jgi:two-component system phosphate regulon sensor histidine kinase PhoR
MAANQPVNIPELLDAIRVEAEALARRAPKPHQIVMDIDRSLWLSGDEAELRSAFANLAYNAINYSPEGGKIILRWQLENAAPRFSVVDQGMGIAQAQIPRITERFYRVDESRSRQSGGTGLGLSIVKHVLVLHQAELKIESQVGQGSTFSCVFPAEKAIIKSSTPILPFGGSDHKRRSS